MARNKVSLSDYQAQTGDAPEATPIVENVPAPADPTPPRHTPSEVHFSLADFIADSRQVRTLGNEGEYAFKHWVQAKLPGPHVPRTRQAWDQVLLDFLGATPTKN